MKTEQEQIDREQVRKPSREQVIIEGLITTLGYREQKSMSSKLSLSLGKREQKLPKEETNTF